MSYCYLRLNIGMTFNWKHLLAVADHLNNNASNLYTEAYFRSAINRAYYACFNIAKKFVQVSPSDIQQHRSVRENLKGHRDLRIQKLGQNFERLYRLRTYADYHTKYPGNENIESNSQIAIKQSKRIVNDLNDYLQQLNNQK